VNTAEQPASDEDFVEGLIIGDHFRILRRLGAGGMGEVYLAENTNLPDKRYAIKVLRKELSSIGQYEQLLRGEAQRQARLDHENIVQLYDYFRWGQRYCLVLAFVEGQTLADMIEAEPNGLPEKRALDLMLEILKGLNHAHEHGVHHCDIKPANVLVDAEQRVRVTDFGIARDIGSVAAQRRGVVVGTPEYMSPEQISDPEHIDHRTDVYSAGVVLFEMLTGKLPFAHEGDPGGVRFPQLTGEPADILDHRKDLSPQLSRVVATALQPSASARFQGCMDFQQAILRYRYRQKWRRTWLPAIAVICVVAIAGAVGSYQWKKTVEARAEAERLENERIAQMQRQENERIAHAERLANEAQARKTVEALIATALKQLRSLCRESERLQARQEGVKTAAAAGFADLVTKLENQANDMRRNMTDYSNSYAAQLGQMARFDDPLVNELIDAHPQQDEGDARFLPAVRSDHAALAAQKRMRSAQDLLQTCAK
jgi:serine/threonine protein kinase